MLGEGGVQVLSLNNFSGGIADFPLDEPTAYEKATNFKITEENTLEVVPGYRAEKYTTLTDVGTPITSIGETKTLGSNVLIATQGKNVFVREGVTNTSIADLLVADPTIIPAPTDINRVMKQETSFEVYLNPRSSAEGEFGMLAKIIRHADQTVKGYLAGLPYVGNTSGIKNYAELETQAVALVNDLKAKYNAHETMTYAYGTTATPVANATDLASAKILLGSILKLYMVHLRMVHYVGPVLDGYSITGDINYSAVNAYVPNVSDRFPLSGIIPDYFTQLTPPQEVFGKILSYNYSPSDEEFYRDLVEMVRCYNIHLFSFTRITSAQNTTNTTASNISVTFHHASITESNWVQHPVSGPLARYTSLLTSDIEGAREVYQDVKQLCRSLSLHLTEVDPPFPAPPVIRAHSSALTYNDNRISLMLSNLSFGFIEGTPPSDASRAMTMEALLIKLNVFLGVYAEHVNKTTIHKGTSPLDSEQINKHVATPLTIAPTWPFLPSNAGISYKCRFPDITNATNFTALIGKIVYGAVGIENYIDFQGAYSVASAGWFIIHCFVQTPTRHVDKFPRYTGISYSEGLGYFWYPAPTIDSYIRGLLAFTYSYKYVNSNGDLIIQESEPIFRDIGVIKITGGKIYATRFLVYVDIEEIPSAHKYPDSLELNVYLKDEITDIYYKIATQAPSDKYVFSPIIKSDLTKITETLYTSTGSQPNTPPPRCLAFTVFEDIAYYGNCYDAYDGTYRPNRVYQSIQGDLDSVPSTFFVDLPSKVMGLGTTRNGPVALMDEGVSRLIGVLNADGSGSLEQRVIDQTANCIMPDSVVSDGILVYFCGRDALYSCDGQSVSLLSDHIRDTYAALPKDFIQAGFSEKHKTVFFLFMNSDRSVAKILCLDVSRVRPGRGCFTLMEGFDLTALGISSLQDLLAGDKQGFILRFSDAYTDKSVINRATKTIETRTDPIEFDYLSSKLSFGSTSYRKYITTMDFTIRDASSGTPYRVSLQPYSVNDNSSTKKYLAEVDYTSQNTELTTQKRHMPARTLRCIHKQVGFLPATRVIQESSGSLVYINKAGLTATLDSGYTFLDAVVGRKMYLSFDKYVQEFTIASLNIAKDTAVLLDPTNALPASGNYDWTVEDYPTDERLEIIAVNIPYSLFTRSVGRNIPRGNKR